MKESFIGHSKIKRTDKHCVTSTGHEWKFNVQILQLNIDPENSINKLCYYVMFVIYNTQCSHCLLEPS